MKWFTTRVLASGFAAGVLSLLAVEALADGLKGRGSIKDTSCCEQPRWGGVYIGAFAGRHWSDNRWSSDETTNFSDQTFHLNLDGVSAGGLIGANMQMGSRIWGIEADLGILRGQDLAANVGFNDESIKTEANWNGHARLRFGLDGGRFMPFIAAGVAFAHTDFAVDEEKRSLLHVGLSLGAGFDMVLHDNWMGRVEFIHDRFAPASGAAAFDSQFFDLTTNTLRGALMYKLN
jgi:outer membrane immunogenic protein